MKHLIKGQKSSQIAPLRKTNDSGDAVLHFTDAEKATYLINILLEFLTQTLQTLFLFFPDRTQDIFEILSIT